ncbi:MAG: RNA-dependent RNA polymerase [Fushun oxya chinensis chuvirus 1]|nr:MAG: RNA-dependent RNA polymerase [Fushun oxya chinensis chuvirus 1]
MQESQSKQSFQNPSSLVFDRKFDTALRVRNCKLFLNLLRSNRTQDWRDQALIETATQRFHIPDVLINSLTLYNNPLPKIILNLLQKRSFKRSQDWTLKADELSKKLCEIQLNYMNSQSSKNFKSDTKNATRLDGDDLPIEIQVVGTVLRSFDMLVNKMGREKGIPSKLPDEDRKAKLMTMNSFVIPELNMKICWNGRVALIYMDNNLYLVPQVYLLMVHNKIFDMFSVLLLAHYQSGKCLEADAYYKVLSFLIELATLSLRHKQKFYSMMKILEGVVTGLTLTNVDGPKNQDFLRSLLTSLLDDTGIEMEATNLYGILEASSIALRHELGCLSKIMGHPYVDIEAGAKKLFKNVTEKHKINHNLVAATTLQCKKQFIKGYRLKHNKWPDLDVHKNASKALRFARENNLDPDNKVILAKFPSGIPMSDYKYVELKKVMQFEFLENFIPYIKDRTISLLRSKVVKSYLSHDPDKLDHKRTRLLLHYLISSELEASHIPYLERYIDSPDLEDLLDYLVIRVVPKEKELKEIFRGFGCKTDKDRARGIVQEKNVKRYLDLYCNEQAMTLSELDILHRLNSFRSIGLAYPGYKPLYIVLDASAWNNHFREDTVDVVMKDFLDKIFGVEIFSKTMKAYKKSLVYIPDGNETFYWEGQDGGIEGLNQDSWVTIYVNQLHVAMEAFPYPHHIFCKGDDMRLVVMIPEKVLEESTIDVVRTSIVSHIEHVLSQLGHKINISESYGSPHYFAFSKQASCGTIELPSAFRKIQKTYGANNAFLCLLDDYIGASFSNAHSTCKNTTDYISCYQVASMWAYYHLLNHNSYKRMSDNQLLALLMIPGLLGGFPVIYLHNFMVRAESDLLPPFLGLLSYCRVMYPEVHEYMAAFLCVNLVDPDEGFVGLLMDEYSLPISKPTSAMTVLRKTIEPALRKITRNEQVKQLFELVDAGVSDEVVETLKTSKVVNGKVAAALYGASPQGLVNELTRKFETARSVVELLVAQGGFQNSKRILRRVVTADRKVHKRRVAWIRMTEVGSRDLNAVVNKTACPAQAAQQLRDLCWQRHIEAVTVPPLQHLISFEYAQEGHISDWSDTHHFEYLVVQPLVWLDNYKIPSYSTSKFAPFIGYQTRNSVVPPRIHFIEKDIILSHVKTLIDLISWTNFTGENYLGEEEESNLPSYIVRMLGLYLDIEPDKLLGFRASKKSGTISHHIRSPNFRESIVPNTLSNIYQQIKGDSNSHRAFRGSGKHYAVNFLHILCYSTCIIGMPIIRNSVTKKTSYKVWATTTPCSYCNTPIIESPIVVKLPQGRPLGEGIRVLQLAAHAEKIVQESISVSKRLISSANPAHAYMTMEIAAVGVIQEFMYTSFHKRLQLVEQTTQRNVNPEGFRALQGLFQVGHSRMASISELVNVPVDVYIYSMAAVIYEYIVINLRISTMEALGTYLNSTAPNDLPWYNVIDKINDAGRLHHIIPELAKISRMRAPTDSRALGQISTFLALSSFALAESGELKVMPIVYLSHYEMDNAADHVRTQMIIILSRLHTYIKKDMVMFFRINVANAEFYWNCLLLLSLLVCRNFEMICEVPDNYGKIELRPFTLEVVDQLMNADVELIPDYQFAPDLDEDTMEEVWRVLRGNVESVKPLFDEIESHCTLLIVHTDFESCSAIMRSKSRREEPETMEIFASSDITGLKIKTHPGVFSTFPLGQELQTSAVCPVDDLSEMVVPESYVIRPSWLSRPFSCGSTGINKLLNIFEAIGIGALPEHNKYICLAEGQGGFASAILCLTRNSTIIYNTILHFPEAEFRPLEALAKARDTGNTVDTTIMEQGYNDLTKSSTVDKFLRSQILSPLITADINDIPDYVTALQHITDIYLGLRTSNGVLIMKIFLRNLPDLLPVVSRIYRASKRVFLYKPASSHPNSETYLIAQGVKLGFPDHGHSKYYPSAKICRVVVHHARAIRQRVREQIINKPRLITIDILRGQGLGFLKQVPSYPSAFLARRLNIVLSDIEFKLINAREWSEVVVRYCRLLAPVDASLKEGFSKRKRNDPDLSLPWSSDTRSRRTRQAERYLMSQGFQVGLLSIRHEWRVAITEVHLRNRYIGVILSLPERFQWTPVTSSHYKGPLNQDGFVSQPYKSFIDGIEAALSAYSWWVGYQRLITSDSSSSGHEDN